MNDWEKYLGVKYPECKKTGQCCSMASPSLPVVDLLRKAAEGDSFARDFLCLFQPYKSREEARSLAPELVNRALEGAKKSSKFKTTDQVVFFRCRFLKGKNECTIYEDRPQLCRDYPDTPYLVVAPGCGFEGWSRQCKDKYKGLKDELTALKDLQETLSQSSYTYVPSTPFIYSGYLVSPGTSWLR